VERGGLETAAEAEQEIRDVDPAAVEFEALDRAPCTEVVASLLPERTGVARARLADPGLRRQAAPRHQLHPISSDANGGPGTFIRSWYRFVIYANSE
jgi:hypothetical protein